MNEHELEPEECVRKARIELADEHPFFNHITNRLNIVKTEEVPTMAVDFRGNMFFNEDFVEKVVSEDGLDSLKGIVIHEAMHIALEGEKRKGSRHHKLFNIAQDIVINHIIVNEEDFSLSDIGYIPKSDGSYSVPGMDVHIEDVSEETFESVYEKIAKDIDNGQDSGEGDGEGEMDQEDSDSNGIGGLDETFDEPIYSEGEGEDDDGDQGPYIPSDVDEQDLQDMDMSSEEANEKWKEIVEGAKNIHEQRSQGDSGGGLYERIKQNQNTMTDYRKYIRETVKKNQPDDFTMVRPHKKSRAHGYFMADIEKEFSVDVIIALDTSGSMSSSDLGKALNEMASVVHSIDSVDITVIQHDVNVTDVKEYEQANENDFQKIEVHGRGGTSHVPVFEKIEEINQKKQTDPVVISITDGYTTVPEELPIPEENLLWVINNYDVGKDRLKYGRIIRQVEDDKR